MKIIDTSIEEVKILAPNIFEDNRGFFYETFKENWFQANVDKTCFVQENQSHSKKNTLRGMHYQINNPQGKLVRVLHGKVYDVAVDLRKTSPTYGKAFGTMLSDENKHQLWIPEGFAHGFYVISDYADLCYKCTDYYAPQYERCLLWNDPEINIQWPIEVGKSPILSYKDSNGKEFKKTECYK